MAFSPATTNDLSARSLRTLSSQEILVGAALLDDAWSIIVAQRPSVSARLDVSPSNPSFTSLVVQVQCAMVLRVLSNPDGKLEEQVDDYRYRLDAARSTGALYVTEAELSWLSAGDGSSDDAFTIRPGGVSVDPITYYLNNAGWGTAL